MSNLIQSFLDGYDVTIFAYGQTGSGKTYTMGTEMSKQTSTENMGIIPRAIKHIFEEINARKKLALEAGNPLPESITTVGQEFHEIKVSF